MPRDVTHKGTGHRQIEAADATLPCVVHTSRHRNREDVITALTHRIRQTCVFTTEEQDIPGSETE